MPNNYAFIQKPNADFVRPKQKQKPHLKACKFSTYAQKIKLLIRPQIPKFLDCLKKP